MRFWHWWLPAILLGIQFIIEATVSDPVHIRLHSENGPVETLQFILLVLSFIVAVRVLTELKFRPPVFLSLWLLLALLGCFYVGGEEISWGQHFLSWTTPEYWAAINDQKETNLHNTSSWLDQKPRLLLELGVITGGLLLPLYRRFGKRDLPGWLKMIAPQNQLMFVAGIFLFIKLADKLPDLDLPAIFRRASEVGEFYVFYFILLYLLDLRQRCKGRI